MKKIPSLFQRNQETDRLVRNEVTPGCEWVLAGEGWATQKLDGTCCLVAGGKLYKRFTWKASSAFYPVCFVPATDVDPVTGKQEGWMPVLSAYPGDRWHREAFEKGPFGDGTYELIGPKVNGNPEHVEQATLVRHGITVLDDVPRSFDGLKDYLFSHDYEGVVFYHFDGRRAKVKVTDFNGKRPVYS